MLLFLIAVVLFVFELATTSLEQRLPAGLAILFQSMLILIFIGMHDTFTESKGLYNHSQQSPTERIKR